MTGKVTGFTKPNNAFQIHFLTSLEVAIMVVEKINGIVKQILGSN